MKKLTLILIGCIHFAPIMSWSFFGNQSAPLSTDKAVAIIWKMKYNDICSLHKKIFPDQDKKTDSNYIDQYINKIEACTDNVYRVIRDTIFGKAVITRILDTLKSAPLADQETIKQAVCDSYEEYQYEFSTGELLIVIFLFPVSLLLAYQMNQDHIKKIEAKRAEIHE